MVPLTAQLAPGDSIVVHLSPNSYCNALQPRLKVFDGCDTQGPLLHHFAWGAVHQVFRHIGTAYLDVDGIFQYSGTACLLSVESPVGLADGDFDDGSTLTYIPGFVRVGAAEEGELTILDGAGRLILLQRVGRGQRDVPLPDGISGGMMLAVLRTDLGFRARRFVTVD